MLLINCACGCGTLISDTGTDGKHRSFVHGHAVRVIQEKKFASYVLPDTKWCNGCSDELPIADFNLRVVKSKGGKTGYRPRSLCKECEYKVSRKFFTSEIGKAFKKNNRAGVTNNIRTWITQRLSGWRAKTTDCNLTTDYLEELWFNQEGNCYYTGVPLIFPSGGIAKNGLSLDRLVPEEGYMQGNVVYCTFAVNTMKSGRSEEEFYSEMLRILEFVGRI